MSQFLLPGWAQEQIAEIEAQVGRPITPDDLACVDINESARTMTVARNPLLAEVRFAENDRNDRSDAFPEYQ
ncbi:MAG TPA: hypothetical protein VGI81_23035 [Tepidisphaeraceae bacterium]|jgi:hypothetical protein